MINTNAKGGNAKKKQAKAKVEIKQKSGLAAVPIPNAPRKPDVHVAKTFEEALGVLNVQFDLKLHRLDGSTEKEHLNIQTLEDFEEAHLVEQSAVLREQQTQMAFLHEFLHQLTHNPAFAEEMRLLLQGETKASLIEKIRGWCKEFKTKDSELLKLIQS